MKELTPTESEHTLEAGITSTELPYSCPVAPPEEKHTTAPDSIPFPMLPPRKRLKASKTEHSAEDTSRVEVKSGRMDGTNCDLSAFLEPEPSSAIQPQLTEGVPGASVSAGSTVESITSSHVATATNLNSVAKYSFAALAAPLQPARSMPFQQAPVRRGRKPRQMAYTSTTAIPQSAAVSQNWTARNGSGDVNIVPATQPAVVAAPTPNVIHIPEDAKVYQSEDGMIIVCQSDGTVHIHGHTEGQPLPLDAIRSLLALDATAGDQTAFAVGDQITQEPSQLLHSQTVPSNSQQSGYESVRQIIGAGGSSNALPVDASQQITVDGHQTLVAFDPDTQSMVQVDTGQAYTLIDGSTLVAVDSLQSVLSISDGHS